MRHTTTLSSNKRQARRDTKAAAPPSHTVMLSAVLFSLATAVGSAHALVPNRSLCPDGTNSAANPTCCRWFSIRDQLAELFDNECGEDAHSTIRIAFHDAAGFSVFGGKGHGADGSIISFGNVELTYADNAGIDDIVDILQPFADSVGISYGDVIQFGSSVALSLCPGAPKVQTFVGRPNATIAAPDGTLPSPQDGVLKILERMFEIGFLPDEVVALLASHSVAAQDKVEPGIAGSPFDSTPGSFDPQFYLETLLKGTAFPGNGPHTGEALSPLPGEFRLQSDAAIARHLITACTWQSFVSNQALMARKFQQAMTKLGLIGQNPALLADCTEVINDAPPATAKKAFFPAGKSSKDIEASCLLSPFPTNLSTQSGTPTPIPPFLLNNKSHGLA